MTGNKKTIIVGGGLSSLMLARMIKTYKKSHANIVIIERDDKIGGQFGSINYGEFGYFDHGMHIYYESCIPEIDRLFTSLLPDDEWNILENNFKDVAGLYVNGRLQTHTPYVDLRNLPEPEWKKYVSDIFFTIHKNKQTQLPENANAYDILKHHFGQLLTDEIFVPILEKLYLTHASNMDEIATHLTTINRVALFDEDVMLDLMQSPEIRARICYPDQFTLPNYRLTKQRGFYPKKYGIFRVLEKFKSVLENEDVEFLTSTVVSDLKIENKNAKSLTISNKNVTTEINAIDEIYWTAGLPSLASALKINLSDLKDDKRTTEAVYVNFLFDKTPNMDKLYYFYCFDKGYRSFRVTNYTNYCPAAADNRGYPVCVEIWAQEADSKDEDDLIALAKKELKSFGVIDDNVAILFSKAEKLLGVGFPLPSINNISNMKLISERIKQCEIKNIIPTGVLSEKNVFFIKDVLTDAYHKVIKS